MKTLTFSSSGVKCRNPTFGRVWGWHSHSQNFRVWLQGSKHLSLRRSLYIGNLLTCRCQKWSRMSHLDICSTSYGKKKGQEWNWQFDSQPLKVGNRPNPSVCRWSATHRWKALKESYTFDLDLILIRGLSKKLWICKVLRVQTGTISRLFLGSPGTKKAIRM